MAQLSSHRRAPASLAFETRLATWTKSLAKRYTFSNHCYDDHLNSSNNPVMDANTDRGVFVFGGAVLPRSTSPATIRQANKVENAEQPIRLA